MGRSPLVQNRVMGDVVLCGMCCLVSGPKEGFMYDVLTRTKLLSCYEYTSDTLSVSACHGLLHAITRQGLETYTVRTYSSASEWVRQQVREQRVRDVCQKLKKKPKTQESLSRTEHSHAIGHEECSQSTAAESSTEIVHPLTETCLGDVSADRYSEGGNSLAGNLGDVCSAPAATAAASAGCSVTDEQETSHSSGTNSQEVFQDTDSSPETGEGKSIQCVTAPKPEVGSMKEVESLSAIRACMPQGSEMSSGSKTVPESAGTKPSSSPEFEQSPSTAAEERYSGDKEFPLPVYDVEWLKQLCPPANLDICLIGMYPVAGPLFVSATEESVALFTRVSHDALQRSRRWDSEMEVEN